MTFFQKKILLSGTAKHTTLLLFHDAESLLNTESQEIHKMSLRIVCALPELKKSEKEKFIEIWASLMAFGP